MQDEKPHKVHFEASDELTHDNNIAVKQIDVGKIDIHVGFLQVMHKYEVIVSIPTVFLPNSENIKPEESTNLFARYQVRGHSTTRWTEFCHFLTPQFLYPERGQKQTFFDPLSPLPCPGSY